MKFCTLTDKLKKVSQKSGQSSALISQSIHVEAGTSYVLFDQVRAFQEEWEATCPPNIFFSASFLELIEHDPPAGIKPFYALIRREDKIIAALSLQLKTIDLAESMNLDAGANQMTLAQKLSQKIKKAAVKVAKFNTLICGNVLLTGEYGFCFADKTMLYADQFQLVETVLDSIIIVLPDYGYKAGPILMKDYYKDKEFSINDNINSQFTEFAVQPNMIFQLKDEWKNFEDYKAVLKSKYRVRVKRAVKKLGEVEKRELNLEDIIEHNQRIYDLYRETANEADFNLFILPLHYFTNLKKYLKEKIKIVAYFLEGEMIGYYTILFNSEYMEAHYLGYDKSKNAARQIYLNMLFDLVKEGIDHQVGTIQFARTALEIKSSVGAVPYDMLCYLKHSKKSLNALAPRLLSFMVPDESWQPRSPFK